MHWRLAHTHTQHTGSPVYAKLLFCESSIFALTKCAGIDKWKLLSAKAVAYKPTSRIHCTKKGLR